MNPTTTPDAPPKPGATPDVLDEERDGDGRGPGKQAVDKLRKGEEVTEKEVYDATDWFLNPDPEEDVSTRTIRLRVGKPGSKREWIPWTVQAMDRERIQQIRDQEKKRQQGGRRGQPAETDEMAANLRIAVEGTISPDLMDEKVRGGMADPADAMRKRFDFKPGLIDQIAAVIMEVSGYSDEDVQDDATTVKA